MCGVPYHSSEAYIARLIAKGYKVAICEQLEDPAEASGIVERGVIRVITPGTVTESSMLEEGRSNYLCALWLAEDGASRQDIPLDSEEFAALFLEVGEANQLPALLEKASAMEALQVRGLMCVPPILEAEGSNRRYFAAMRQLFIDNGGKKYDNVTMDFLSMGMTDDYPEAIAEGANMVRIGTGIFGARPYHTRSAEA